MLYMATSPITERHLRGLAVRLGSAMNGKRQEAIRRSCSRILVGLDGALVIEAKPDSFLGPEGSIQRSVGNLAFRPRSGPELNPPLFWHYV